MAPTSQHLQNMQNAVDKVKISDILFYGCITIVIFIIIRAILQRSAQQPQCQYCYTNYTPSCSGEGYSIREGITYQNPRVIKSAATNPTTTTTPAGHAPPTNVFLKPKIDLSNPMNKPTTAPTTTTIAPAKRIR